MHARVTLIGVFVAVLFGSAARTDTAVPEPAITCGPAGSALTARDLRYAREYGHLLTAKASSVWPGWRQVPTLLQRNSRCEYLIGHPAPPKPFRRVTGVNVLGRPVYAASAGTLTPGPVAATWKVGKAWVAMVPTRAEFQRALDRRLGSGVVRLNDTTYMRSLVHEAFHAHQMSVTRGALPSFGSTLDEQQATKLLSGLGDADARLAVEGQALSAALAASSLEGARTAASAFLLRRAERRGATGDAGALGAFGRQIEWAEGTARYVDLRLVLLASARGYKPTEGIRYTPAAEYRRSFVAELVDPAPRPDGFRGRWQSLGAAEAMLLDRLVSGWRSAVLPGRFSLEALLAEAVDVPAPLADLRVARITVGRTPMRVALAERPDQRSAGLTGVTDLDPLDGMLFAFAKDVSAAFWMQGALMPLDIAFFAADGRLLSVQTMPLCSSDPCPQYRSPRPFRFALEVPQGGLPARAGARLTVLP